MKLRWNKILKTAKIIVLTGVVFGSIGLVEKQHGRRMCTAINVEIDNQFQNYFINESDVIDLITNGGENRIVGEPFDELNLKEIEKELLSTKFIRNAEVFKDLEGTLMISINQSRPVARLMSTKTPKPMAIAFPKLYPFFDFTFLPAI